VDPKNIYYRKRVTSCYIRLALSVNILSKELYDFLDLDKKIENVTLNYYFLMILPSMP
jgi:hypothetical protein